MCGIVAVFGGEESLRGEAVARARRLRHRGPDWSGAVSGRGYVIAHERLAIVGVDSGSQPLRGREDDSLLLAVNGEIYNHRELRPADYPFRTGSDCEVILPLYESDGGTGVESLRGMFAFVLFDSRSRQVMVARDHMGIAPLYMGSDSSGCLWFASEMKALVDICDSLEVFPPGHRMLFAVDEELGVVARDGGGHPSPEPWYDPAWMEELPATREDPAQVRDALQVAVVRRMMTDVPWGVLLSGGLDSSLVAAIACRHADRRTELDGTAGEGAKPWWPRVHTFSIGLEGSPDLAAAQKVADMLDTAHHPYTFTVDEGLDALEGVIDHIETYDVTTVRASTPMYLLARLIRSLGIKMVLSGEGADEIFGGYLYFHKAPNPRELHEETVRKLRALHLYDCLRANKSMAAWGVEARVPFLDADFMEVAMNLDPAAKMCRDEQGRGRTEKHVLRAAFCPEQSGCERYLPHEVLWRQKEQFSDGVGYGWIDALRDRAEQEVSDRQLAEARRRFPLNPPQTKEAYLYRQIFARHFPSAAASATVPGGPSIACSTAKAIEWDESFKDRADPSGRMISGVHRSAIGADGE